MGRIWLLSWRRWRRRRYMFTVLDYLHEPFNPRSLFLTHTLLLVSTKIFWPVDSFLFFFFLQFYVRIEEKLPAYNTRIRLPELRMRDGESWDMHTCTHTHRHKAFYPSASHPQTNTRKRRRVMSLPERSWSASHSWLSSQSPRRSPGKMKSSDLTQEDWLESESLLSLYINLWNLHIYHYQVLSELMTENGNVSIYIVKFVNSFGVFRVTRSTSVFVLAGATLVFSSSFWQFLS